MEKDRLIKILELVKEELKTKRLGICHTLVVLCSNKIINSRESRFIEGVLKENKPTPTNEYKEFTQNPYWDKPKNGYWWSAMMDDPETRQIRIDYVTKLISNLK